MGEITRIDGTESPSEGHEIIPHQRDLIEITNGILMDTRSGYGGIHVSLPLLHAEGNGAVHCICA